MRIILSYTLFVLLVGGAFSYAGEADPKTPVAIKELTGIFALNQDKPFKDSIYDLDIMGYSMRAYWRVIEPEKGKYNWKLFDDVVAHARAKNKKVKLFILFGSGVPEWVACKTIVGSARSQWNAANQMVPIPWDENLRREQRILIRDFAERYRNEPAVVLYQVIGPSAGWGEMQLPDNLQEQPGFSKEVLLECWKEIIDEWKEVGGSKRLALAISAPPPFYPALATEVATYALMDSKNHGNSQGTEWCFQWQFLDMRFETMVKRNSAQWIKEGLIGWQFAGSTAWEFAGSTPEDRHVTKGYEESLRLAMECGSTFIEVYQEDLIKPELGKIAEQINEEMKLRMSQRHQGQDRN